MKKRQWRFGFQPARIATASAWRITSADALRAPDLMARALPMEAP